MINDKTYNDLLINVSNGNVAAYNKLYELFYSSLCVFAGRYISDSAYKEDCVQDVFFNIWNNRQNIDLNTSARSYLLTATKNKCLNYLAHKKIELTYEQYILNTYDEFTTDDLYSVDELQAQLENAINKLPEKLRTVFALSRFQNLTYREIAEQQNISVKTVEAYMHKSLVTLSLHLKDYLPFYIILVLLKIN